MKKFYLLYENKIDKLMRVRGTRYVGCFKTEDDLNKRKLELLSSNEKLSFDVYIHKTF